MKFDSIIGNPPFSEIGKEGKGEYGRGGKTILYPQFFKLATEISKVGAMIMPPTRVDHAQTKHHNELIRSIADKIIDVSEEDRENMGVGTAMWTIYWGSEGNVDEHFVGQEIRNDVNWQRGKPAFYNINMSKEKTETHKVLAIKSILQQGPAFIYTDLIKEIQGEGWYVLFNYELNGARGFNTSVTKLDGKTQLGSNVRYVKFQTKKEATDFESKMKTPDFVEACRAGAGNIRKTVTIGVLRTIEMR